MIRLDPETLLLWRDAPQEPSWLDRELVFALESLYEAAVGPPDLMVEDFQFGTLELEDQIAYPRCWFDKLLVPVHRYLPVPLQLDLRHFDIRFDPKSPTLEFTSFDEGYCPVEEYEFRCDCPDCDKIHSLYLNHTVVPFWDEDQRYTPTNHEFIDELYWLEGLYLDVSEWERVEYHFSHASFFRNIVLLPVEPLPAWQRKDTLVDAKLFKD